MDQNRGGSYADRSFLRSAICPKPGEEGQILVTLVSYFKKAGLT